jgi:hypothetical protein
MKKVHWAAMQLSIRARRCVPAAYVVGHHRDAGGRLAFAAVASVAAPTRGVYGGREEAVADVAFKEMAASKPDQARSADESHQVSSAGAAQESREAEPVTRAERRTSERRSLDTTDASRLQDCVDDGMFRYESSSLLDDIVGGVHEAALEMRRPDLMKAERHPDAVRITVATTQAGDPLQWEVRRDLATHKVMLQSGSGTYEYIFNVLTKAWDNVQDGHDLRGLLTRDLLRLGADVPAFPQGST